MKGAIKLDDLYNIQDLLRPEDVDIEENEDAAPAQEAEILEQKIIDENIKTPLKLDYTISTCEGRAELVERILALTPKEKISNRYLEILGDYVMGGLSKEEKKSHLYLTDNRLVTINKRETSFEGVIEKFENGEDGIYNLITNDKNVILTQKNTITEQDVKDVPGLSELRQDILTVEKMEKEATGKRKYLLKKQLIEMRKDQYVLKSMFKPQICTITSTNKGANKIALTGEKWVDENGEPQSSGLVSFFNPKHISAILCNYHALKVDNDIKYQCDFYYLMEDFDKLLKKALNDYPMYRDIVHMKINNKTNLEIAQELKNKYNISYSAEYLSSLWRQKIPKIIAEKEKEDFLLWYFTFEKKGVWKTCSCCKQTKLAHNKFFSKNKTSKDGFYSICKECRNKK